MGSFTSVNLHRFAGSILAEVVEESGDGEISIRSHELSYANGDDAVLRPESSLSSTDAMLIEECARADGYPIKIDRIAGPATRT